MKTPICLAALLFVGVCFPPQAGAYDPNDKVLKEALQLYNGGHVERAIPLFLQDLKDNPNNGTAHYYLGMALKEHGADANAISELELAAKLLPAGVTQELAKKALHGGFEEDPIVPSTPTAPAKAAPAQPQNWFSPILNFFQPPPKSAEPRAPVFVTPSLPAFPDLVSPMGDAWKSTKHWIRGQGKAVRSLGKKPSDARQTRNGEPDVIPMGEMLNLADDSHALPGHKQSHPGGVVVFEQAPENSLSWDNWIRRFRKTFDAQVFRYLFKDAKDERTGIASVIFSVDSKGHLRGAVYSATADDTLQQCLLKAIRDLDKSYILAFPPESGISGWNFRMTWNFGKALTFVQMVRERRAKLAAVPPPVIKIDTAAMIKKMKQDQLSAQAKKLAEQKRLAKTKMAVRVPPPPVVKTDVNAQLVKPVELKANALKLSDMPPLPKNAKPLTREDMDEFNILNQDVSGLFH
ncbi:MAG: tetratricopeptide repeat protein [Candidatus Melainabacteria bacterium]|nr:MAG: tetratricopeptide repeat protein [Candidatus Melainabacteria bacterium]